MTRDVEYIPRIQQVRLRICLFPSFGSHKALFHTSRASNNNPRDEHEDGREDVSVESRWVDADG